MLLRGGIVHSYIHVQCVMYHVLYPQEKWDSMTRKWRDHKSLVQLVRLFLIDEVHQLNDEVRGPTMEAIVSRMKTIRAASAMAQGEGGGGGGEVGRNRGGLRFIAVSATIPNITDVSRAVPISLNGQTRGQLVLECVTSPSSPGGWALRNLQLWNTSKL